MSDISTTETQSNAEQPVGTSMRDAFEAALAAQRSAPEETDETETSAEAGSIHGQADPEHGKFASETDGKADNGKSVQAGDNAPVSVDDNGDQVDPEPGTDASRTYSPPPSWSVDAKAEYDALPDAVKADIAKRETEISKGFERLKVLKELEPYEQLAAQHGTSVAGALESYVAAEQLLTRDPVAGIAWLIQQYNPNLEQLSAAIGANRTAQQPANDPVLQRIHSLETQLRQRDQQEAANRTAGLQTEIEAFAADPANRYFENVKQDMGVLLRSGRASDLKSAYEMAVWANPETRKHLQADQQRAADADRKRKEAERVSKARNASGGLTGSPMPGATAPGDGKPLSIRDAIAQAYDKHGVNSI